jgi:hypothetical protein
MPVSIAHIVIAHNALTLLKDKGFKELADFAARLDDPAKDSLCQAYMNLGSIGPDLYYYADMAQSAKEMLLEGFVDTAGVTPWSYHLHSQKPNQFPLHLSEILFQDAVWEDDIENSVDNLLLVLRVCKLRGPYKEAQAQYEEQGADSDMYREYIAEPDYLTYYNGAVRLSATYIAALYEVYTTLAAGQDFDDPQNRRFREVVSDADLSCPLEKDILQKTHERLVGGPGGANYEPLFA